MLLRKLVNSTGIDISLVDFPGYDQAEKKGWDGRVEAGAATPWIPIGKSAWEFGCNKDPKQKADKDYSTRVKAIPRDEAAALCFIFVTPRNWNGKDKWRNEKEALGEWKSVRAYDASDLEQWLEQSLQARGWLSEQIGVPSEGVHSLDAQWKQWAAVTEPELSKELFAPSVEKFKSSIKSWIEDTPSSPLVICGDSKLEALAFLHCLLNGGDRAFDNFKDRVLVFSSATAIRKLITAAPTVIPIVVSDEVEQELGGVCNNRHTIIVRPKNMVEPEPTVVLDFLRYDPFKKALEAMGIEDHFKIRDLARRSGYSPTILRRHLAKFPAIRTPKWAQDNSATRKLMPVMLVGTWNAQSKGDSEIMSYLAGDEIEQDVTQLLQFEDPPVWSVGKFRGVTSKIDAFFAVHASVTQTDLENFFFIAEIVLSEKDPALELPEDKRIFANIYGKSRDHSKALRDGIAETLVLLAVHGNDLFAKRLGVDVRVHVDMLVRRLLTPLTPEKLFSQVDNMPLYAEAAPKEFLHIMDEDLGSSDPQVYSLLKPANTGMFGYCPRTGLLWALETLAWKAEQLLRVTFVLAKLAEQKINDNWANTPERSLQAIFRSWMPQTSAPIEDRKKALQALVSKYPAIGWEVCVAQFDHRREIGQNSHRPRWRNDASGAGHRLKTWEEIIPFVRTSLDLALAWPSHNEKTLGDLVAILQGLHEPDQDKVWNLIGEWAATEKDENRKAVLREHIRQFAVSRRIAKQGLTEEVLKCARTAYDVLTPTDLVMRNYWLFEQHFIFGTFDPEDPELDYEKREERVRTLRIAALEEIWEHDGFEGIKSLVAKSGSASTIGCHMAEAVNAPAVAAAFLEQCLRLNAQNLADKFDQVIRSFLLQVDAGDRARITERLATVLSAPLLCRYLKCSPFQRDTWAIVDAMGNSMREQYWHEVYPDWLRKDSPDLNDVVDRLLQARRPRAAFSAVQFAFEELETSRLQRLLQEVGTCDAEVPGVYRIDAHYLSEALNILQLRAGVSEEEMARLEFHFIAALEYRMHGIPNLERQIGKSPALFAQILALIYRRNDGGEDPPEWDVKDNDRRAALATVADHLLENIKHIPGANGAGRIDEDVLRTWVKEARVLCAGYGRAEIGDQKIGKILSSAPVGTDGIWPCEGVRHVLEECGTPDMATGVQIGIYNSRGAHARAEGGVQERGLAEVYKCYSRQLSFASPYVANLIDGIARSYDREADMWDSEYQVRRRLEL